MSYKHGVYISETPTSIVAPVTVNSAIPIFFVTAPVHLAKDPYNITNVPKLCYSYKEAVEHFGHNTKQSIWDNYTSVQSIYSQFALYGIAPMIIVNVLNPLVHKADVMDSSLLLQGLSAVLEVDGVLLDTIKIKKNDTEYYVLDIDYSVAFDDEGFVVFNVYDKTLENTTINIEYTKLDPSLVDEYDIIGGYNATTGKNEGLELINEIYPRFRVVPTQIVAPKFSSNVSVASIMDSKASNINGHFKAIALIDIPSTIDYTEVPAYKNDNNLISSRQINCYPMLQNGEQFFYYSVQLAGLIGKVDSENGGVPYASPSNQNLKINGLVDKNGIEKILQIEQANFLNSNGVMTAINFSKGFTAWGNKTGAYPGVTDVKDTTIPVRRMFDWIGNTLVLTYWQKIDLPMTKRNIDTIIDSMNMWLNGLTSSGYILGGRVEFDSQNNSDIDLLDGNVTLKVNVTPPTPMKSITFNLEFDTNYLSALFS